MNQRLAAILAADVVGYSRLMADDQNGTLAALRDARERVIEPRVAQFRGTIIKRLGDGWIIEFASISDAVACAKAIQTGLLDQREITLRIGIHIGDVVFEGEDVFGDGVNIAARLEALASAGQVLISDTARQSLDQKKASAFSGGELHELKNIARPVAVWQWAVNSERKSAGSASHASAPEKPSVAVLPFENMSGDPDQDLDYPSG